MFHRFVCFFSDFCTKKLREDDITHFRVEQMLFQMGCDIVPPSGAPHAGMLESLKTPNMR